MPSGFFDCDVMLGASVVPPAAPLPDARALLEEMDACEIGEALVYHYAAAFGPEAVARMNKLTLAAARRSGRLTPCAALAVAPSAIGKRPEGQVAALIAAGFRAARVVPGEGPSATPILLRRYELDTVFAELERHRMPLLIPVEHLPGADPILAYGFDEIHALCAEFPKLPVILLRPRYGAQSAVIALMRRHSNLHLSATLLTLFRQVESFAAMFGPERVLFGSHMPHRDASVPWGNIAYGKFSDRDRELIAGGNLRRLLGGVQ
jgi:predicted TIM-barrel fold metal-dependent hydrolase